MDYINEIIIVLMIITPVAASLRIVMTCIEIAGNPDSADTNIKRIKNVIKIAILIQCIGPIIKMIEYYYM